MRFVPYSGLDGRPNVIVDGAPAAGTVLTLSHWAHTPAPPGMAADLSTQMALAYAAGRPGPVDVVSNDHFDQDGLMSVFALVDPDTALACRELVVDIAAAGDFATYRSRHAARVSMAIAAMGAGGRDSDSLYAEALELVPAMLRSVEPWRDVWAEEDATLDRSEQLVRSGAVRIDEVVDLDLAVVDVPEDAPDAGGHRFGFSWTSGLHPMAVHNATDRFAVLTMRGRRYELAYRFESWVQLCSRRPRSRVDLRPLADELSAADSARWVADGPEALMSSLRLVDGAESSLDAAAVQAAVERHLAAAPPAWDPYARNHPFHRRDVTGLSRT